MEFNDGVLVMALGDNSKELQWLPSPTDSPHTESHTPQRAVSQEECHSPVDPRLGSPRAQGLRNAQSREVWKGQEHPESDNAWAWITFLKILFPCSIAIWETNLKWWPAVRKLILNCHRKTQITFPWLPPARKHSGRSKCLHYQA
jgi:hypothetical protein